MSELVFVLKSFAITIALILVMQIKIGNTTVQNKTLGWMQNSVAVDGLRYVAEGAVAVGSKSWNYVSSLARLGAQITKEKTEDASRGYSWELKRSDAYYKQKRREEEKRKVEAAFDDGPMGDEID